MRVRFVYLLAALSMALSLFGLGPSAMAQDDSVTTDVCKNGGYLNWLDDASNPFKNQGQCVAFVAQGGVLQPVAPVPSLVVEQVQFGPGGTCQFWIRAYNFPEAVNYTLETYGFKTYYETGLGTFPSGHVIFGVSWPSDGVTYNIYTVAYDSDGNLIATSPTVPVYCPTA